MVIATLLTVMHIQVATPKINRKAGPLELKGPINLEAVTADETYETAVGLQKIGAFEVRCSSWVGSMTASPEEAASRVSAGARDVNLRCTLEWYPADAQPQSEWLLGWTAATGVFGEDQLQKSWVFLPNSTESTGDVRWWQLMVAWWLWVLWPEVGDDILFDDMQEVTCLPNSSRERWVTVRLALVGHWSLGLLT